MQGVRARKSIYQHLLVQAKSCWPHLAGILGLGVIATPLSLLLPLPLKIAVDSVLGAQAVPHWLAKVLPASALASRNATLIAAAALLLAIAILTNLQSLAAWLLQTYTGEKLVLDLRAQLFWHTQRLSLSFHDRKGMNDTAYRIQNDAPAIQYIFIQGVIPLMTAALGFLAMMYVTARISWQLAIIAVLLSPVLMMLARQSTRRVQDGWNEVKELDSSAMLVLYEALSAMRAVKAFGQEGREDERFKLRSRARMLEQVRLASIQAGFHVLIGLTIAVGTAAALVVGVRQVMTHVLTVGELLLVMAYMAQLYEPLRVISSKFPELQSWWVSLQRALALLDEAPEVQDRPGAKSVDRARGEVEFRNVSFEYTPGKPVLQDITVKIPSGTRVGIVGPSGSGKSTLLNVLTRFYDPAGGEVLLDGRALSEYKITDLRNQYAIVLQEPYIFSASVAANIAYGRPEASREAVIAAAKAANAHDFISVLPQGYDTLIGEKGIRLSGGERQRVALARAYLKDSPVLILDEPTSSVDIKTEAAIMEATQKLMAGRTTFMIAHRLTTVAHCDMLLVMNNGRLTTVTSEVAAALEKLQVSHPVAAPATA